MQYEGGCGGYNNTRCIAFQTCSAGSYLDEASQFSAGVCRRCTNCTAQGLSQILSCQNRSDAFCGGASCGSGKPCNVTYDSKGFCVQAVSACGVCPPGYGSDGVACRGCPRGFTCDRRGDVACVGECPPGVYVECQVLDNFYFLDFFKA